MPWTTNLTRPIILDNGTELVTFKDAIEALINGFARTTDRAATELAIELLVKANNSKNASDIEAATDQIERVLRPRELME